MAHIGQRVWHRSDGSLKATWRTSNGFHGTDMMAHWREPGAYGIIVMVHIWHLVEGHMAHIRQSLLHRSDSWLNSMWCTTDSRRGTDSTTCWWPRGAHRTTSVEWIQGLIEGNAAHIKWSLWHRSSSLSKATWRRSDGSQKAMWHRSDNSLSATWPTSDVFHVVMF